MTKRNPTYTNIDIDMKQENGNIYYILIKVRLPRQRLYEMHLEYHESELADIIKMMTLYYRFELSDLQINQQLQKRQSLRHTTIEVIIHFNINNYTLKKYSFLIIIAEESLVNFTGFSQFGYFLGIGEN